MDYSEQNLLTIKNSITNHGGMCVKKIFSIAIIFTILLICIAMIQPCYANSAEPPSIIIIVSNAPDDLEINIVSDDVIHKARKINKVVETYYTFYSGEMKNLNDYIFSVSTNNESYEIKLDKPLQNYNNIYTLDLKSHTLTNGKLLSRSIYLVSMRVLLTLAIEGLIFLLFGFKRKNSWAIFLIINLITQGALNIWINSFTPTQGYIIFGLIFGEIFILIAEIIAFLMFVKEHNSLRKVLYIFTANFISLIAGGYIITILPI